MYTFTRKKNATQQTTSTKSLILSRGRFGHSPEVKSIIRSAHDLSGIPLNAKAHAEIQPKLEIGASGDIFEQEADLVADRVVHMKHPEVGASGMEESNQLALQLMNTQIQPGSSLGKPLDNNTNEEMNSKIGFDFSNVRVHTNESAMNLNNEINARAFTYGSDIFFNKNEYNPHSYSGKMLLAHELTHVLQQRGSSKKSQGKPARLVQRKPSYLVNANFIGTTVEVNPVMRDRLKNVETDLRAQYDALSPDSAERIKPGGSKRSFREWAGIQTARAWRSGSKSFHASGSAIDVNYALQPYIATRTILTKPNGKKETIYGGEAAGSNLQDERRNATEVYDRAMEFTTEGSTADVGARKSGESTASVYNRFYSVDYALRRYFSLVFHKDPKRVDRMPVVDIEGITDDDLLSAIPTSERREKSEAIKALAGYMHTGFSISRASWPLTPEQQFFRILRDYEHVRIPMVMGNPKARPARTRNPTHGFLDMTRKFAVSMVDVGHLRWGISDFGAHSSGDVHHFDLGDDYGYTRDGTP